MEDAVDLKEFECAIGYDEHFVDDPIKLACNHHVCSQCILNKQCDAIRCRICKHEIERTNNKFNQKVELNLDEYMYALEQKAKIQIGKLISEYIFL